MPVFREEFDAGEHNAELHVYVFLRDRSNMAFTAEEILFELGGLGIITSREEVSRALTALVNRRRLESRDLGDGMYYTFDRPSDFGRHKHANRTITI